MKIGDDFLYVGSDHPYLFGRLVRVVCIHKGYFTDPDNYTLIIDNATLEQAGEITTNDLIEVVPFVDHEQGTTGRITSDVGINDLSHSRLVMFLLALAFRENIQLLHNAFYKFFYSPN